MVFKQTIEIQTVALQNKRFSQGMPQFRGCNAINGSQEGLEEKEIKIKRKKQKLWHISVNNAANRPSRLHRRRRNKLIIAIPRRGHAHATKGELLSPSAAAVAAAASLIASIYSCKM